MFSPLPRASARRISVPALGAMAAFALATVVYGGDEVSDPPPDAVTGIIIPITDMISDVTTESIKRRVGTAIERGAEVIVFEIHTNGGYVTSALEICDYIKNLNDVKTVAWIHTKAYSAGSMIAVACDEIVMAQSSVLGDCGVILGGPTGPQEGPEQLRAKAESPVLEQFRDSAQRNKYDVLLCEAMVVKEREVYWLENVDTGRREFVEKDEMEKRCEIGPKSTTLFGIEISPSHGDKPEWRLVETYHDPIGGPGTKIQQPVVASTELLTMSQSRAHALGFSKGIVSNEDELRERYGLNGPIETIDFSWSEVFTRWLTSMPVRGFLLVILMLGVYVEFNTPGVGVAGLVALIALAIFLGAPFLTGLANVWEVVLVAIGFALIGVEIFVIPGFGLAGISGIILVIVGLLATFMPDEPGRFPIYWPELAPSIEGLMTGVRTLAISFGLTLLGIFLLAKYLPQMPYMRGIAPPNPTPADVMAEDPYGGLARVGDFGVAVGDLRPAGKARFGTQMVDVVSEGEMLDDAARIEVIERHGNRVVVRRAKG